jgi:glycosyltransferase involved in cell wall biosynthesis
VTRKALRVLYQKATALLTTSFYESFNFPVLESLSQGTQAIGLREAIIPELRPYVRLADDMDEFIDLMKKAFMRPLKVKKEIGRVFSWKKYVNELVKLYQL